MTVVGLRELRQNASEYLRLVEAGETVQVSRRGRPVALWVPIRADASVARLEAESRLSEAAGDLLDLGSPLRPVAGSPLPSQVLAAARERER